MREREGREKQWIGDRREVRRSEVGKDNLIGAKGRIDNSLFSHGSLYKSRLKKVIYLSVFLVNSNCKKQKIYIQYIHTLYVKLSVNL